MNSFIIYRQVGLWGCHSERPQKSNCYSNMECSPEPHWQVEPHLAAGRVFVPSLLLLVLLPPSSVFPVPGFAAPSRQWWSTAIYNYKPSAYAQCPSIPPFLSLLLWHWESADLLSGLLLFRLSLHLLHFYGVNLPPSHEQVMVTNAQLQDLEIKRKRTQPSSFSFDVTLLLKSLRWSFALDKMINLPICSHAAEMSRTWKHLSSCQEVWLWTERQKSSNESYSHVHSELSLQRFFNNKWSQFFQKFI